LAREEPCGAFEGKFGIPVETAAAGKGQACRQTIIEVSDTGPGVPPTVRPKLFDAFFTSDRAGGTGLGLVIAADLVRAHGGSLGLAPPPRVEERGAETEPPGARFVISLPRYAADADPATEGAPARGSARFETTTS
jgi:signal transduction histidine kinase